MFGQPRCREWTPLATQQLRLRSLIQIVGYNIQEEDGSLQTGSLYYTLHTTTMSSPFYTSEKLLSNHPKWREIDSELIHKMSSTSVVVRIWRHVRQDANTLHVPSDTIVQTWGVNFNGLLHIGANLALDFSPKSFKNNTIVFQMIGGYFCSYNSLKLEPSMKIPGLEQIKNETTVGKEASPSRKIPIDKNTRFSSESKSISPGKSWKAESYDSRANVSKSQSPPVGCFRQSYSSHRSSNSNSSHRQDYYYAPQEGRERKRSDSYNSSIYEHSPKSENDVEIREYVASDESSDALKSCGSLSASSRDLHRLDVEESEQAETIDANTPPVPKCRYSSMKFLKSEIRPSYTAEKLQKLHELQYKIKRRTEAVQEIKEKIYKKSAIENCEDLSPHGALADNEDFSRSEKLSMSCREYSLFKGKNKSSSRSLGKLLSDSNLSLLSSEKDLSKTNDAGDENLEDSNNKNGTVPPDKGGLRNIRRSNVPSNKYLANNLLQVDRRFTLPLNKLLEFKTQPSPWQRLRHSQLTRQAELSRFKRRLLQDERDAALANLRRLTQHKCGMFEENQDNSTELMQSYHSLSRKAEQLRELKKSEAALKELYQRSCSLLLARRWRLVQDLQLIYPITEEESGGFQILNISLPACKDNSDGLRQCSEADLAVALGRVAHVTALSASLLGAPLRHPVRLMGSRTKVLDHVAQENESNNFLMHYNARHWLEQWNILPDKRYLPMFYFISLHFPHRLIPLFARNKDSMMFRYGLFLLNRNIAQLLWATHRVITPDPRNTLANLRKLLTPPTVTTGLDASRLFGSGSSMETTGTGIAVAGLIHPMSASSLLVGTPAHRGIPLGTVHSHQSLRTMIPKHHHHRPFNRFKDSVDGTSPKQAMLIRKHRYSRSVGSYVDEQNLQALEMDSSVIGSEPSLLLLDSPIEVHSTNEPKPSSSQQEKNIQSLISFSESDLTNINDIISPESCPSAEDLTKTKVVFSLGDDCHTPEESRKSPRRQLSKSKSLETDTVVNSAELQELKCDVDRLSKEIQVLYSDCDSEYCGSPGKSEDGHFVSRCGTIMEDPATIKCLDFSVLSDENNDQTVRETKFSLKDDCDIVENDEDQEYLLNVRSFEAYENEMDEGVATISNIVPKTNKDGKEASKNSTDQTDCAKTINIPACVTVDIEKLGLPSFCNQPCGTKCPIATECPKVLKTGYDQCENGRQVMQDVIVLPSAEAVMTTSSHFTDSPLFDPQNRGDMAKSPSDIDLSMNSEELISLAKRVLKFEDEETSNSILAVLKRSSIENENKTENEAFCSCSKGTNNSLCSNSISKDDNRCKGDVECCQNGQIVEEERQRHKLNENNKSNNVYCKDISDGFKRSDGVVDDKSSFSVDDCISVMKSDISLSSPNESRDRNIVVQTKSGEDISHNVETNQDVNVVSAKRGVNGYS